MLYCFPSDRTGCGFYRVGWPLGEIRDRVPLRIVWPGDDVPLLADIDRKTDGLGRMAPSVKGVQVPDDCSAVLLQRPCSVLLVQCIPFLKARGIKVIVEIDDDLHSLTPRHASYAAFNKPAADPFAPVPLDNSLDALMRACALADLVICSTPALLARYCPDPGSPSSPRGVVLRNRLRSDFRSCLKKNFSPVRTAPLPDSPRVSHPVAPPIAGQRQLALLESDKDELRVGWAGVITTHPDDLSILNRALPRAGISQFHILGPAPRHEEGGLARAKRLLGIDAIHFTGSVTFADYLPRLAQHPFDIGVAPLEVNRFNRSKSALKTLEYAACGIPVLHSIHDEYDRLGVGWSVPDDYKDWARALKILLNEPSTREELIQSGYEVADRNTYANFADEWYDAIAPFVDGAT